MFQNYLIIAFRNLLRNRTFSVINILGLSVGLACCLLVFLVIRFHLSFDQHHAKINRIYTAVSESFYPGGSWKNAGVPGPFAKAFRSDFPQVETVARVHRVSNSIVVVMKNGQATDKKFKEEGGTLLVEPSYFDIFDLKILAGGNLKKAFLQPNQAVITQKLATKYFGDWKTALGQSFKINNDYVLKVVGIIEDYPANTDFGMELLVSFKTLDLEKNQYYVNDVWGSTSSNSRVYFTIPENTDVTKLQAQMPKFVKKYLPKQDKGKSTVFSIRPVAGGHYDENFPSLNYKTFKYSTMWTLGLVGILILLMACINFINLSTAQSVKRSKEVGIRKVMGSGRGQLVKQFLGETLLIVLLAVVIALALAELAVPFMQKVIDVPESLSLLSDPIVWAFLFVIIVLVTFLAGFYPSMILSGFEPVTALKSKMSSQKVGGLSLRRALVVLQFGIAQLLVIGTVIVLSQMDYIRKADIGLDASALIITDNPAVDSVARQKFEGFKNQLSNLPNVKMVSFSSDVPSSDNSWSSNMGFDNKDKDIDFQVYQKYADTDYFKVYGLTFLAGGAYTQGDTARNFVINETMMKKLGYKNAKDILGKNLRMGGSGGMWKPITGVVKDFKTNSLREEVKPTVMMPQKDVYYQIGIKIAPQNIDQTSKAVKAVWEKYYPAFVYGQSFYDEQIANFYRSEDQLSLLFRIFAGIAIFISCLGLYGLVAFMAVQRTKEIGIRKVMGASVSQIVVLFSKEFVIMVLLAFVIAAPVAYYLMDKWLGGFVFKISMGFGVFLLALVASLVVAIATMGFRAYRAAIENPVNSLKTE